MGKVIHTLFCNIYFDDVGEKIDDFAFSSVLPSTPPYIVQPSIFVIFFVQRKISLWMKGKEIRNFKLPLPIELAEW